MTAPQPKPWRRIWELAGIALAAIAIAGCGIDQPGPGGTAVDKDARRQQQFQQLMQHPDIEQATQRYSEMLASLRARLETELGIGPWYENPKTGGAAGCGEPYLDVEPEDKESRGLRHWIVEGNMLDNKWARLVTITEEIARTYDFETPLRVIVDRPGDHEITAADTSGADLILGTKVNTVLDIRTGCHLTAAAHQRGTPTIPTHGR